MRIAVDADVCQGHTLCSMNAPALFDISEDGSRAVALLPPDADVPPELEASARLAAGGCPERAIRLTEPA
ncbi:MAG TPA: ferredoxin [Mycobacteriales bacterium]|nr:ferredoxin [Mycobacteriales bacterium]